MNPLYEEARRVIRKAHYDLELMKFDKHTQQIIRLIDERTKEICSSKEKARAYLIGLGIYNEDGSLHENYGGKTK